MDFLSYIMGKSHGGGNAGGGSGGGSSNYDGVLCYDCKKQLETSDYIADGITFVRVSDNAPNLTGKKFRVALRGATGSDLSDPVEVITTDEEDPDIGHIKIWSVFDGDIPVCVVVSEESSEGMELTAGVWVTEMLAYYEASFIMFV